MIFSTLSRLSLRQFLMLLGVLLSSPLFSGLTLIATFKTIKISKKIFPNTHFRNGRGNAFRHALWCCLIMMYCCKVSSPQKSLKWCKKITDMHEKLFVSDEPMRMMDLHNNKIGMDLFISMLGGIHRQFFETSFFIDPLLCLSQESVLISSKKDIIQNKMVIIEDID